MRRWTRIYLLKPIHNFFCSCNNVARQFIKSLVDREDLSFSLDTWQILFRMDTTTNWLSHLKYISYLISVVGVDLKKIRAMVGLELDYLKWEKYRRSFDWILHSQHFSMTSVLSNLSKLHMHMIRKSGISRGNRINSGSYNHASKGDSYKDME